MKWEDITFEEFYKINNIIDKYKDNNIECYIHLICLLFSKKEEEVRYFDLDIFSEYVSKILFIFNSEPIVEICKEIKINNEVTLAIPDSFYEMSIAHYIDIDSTVKSDTLDAYSKALQLAAVILFPKNIKYTEKEPFGFDVKNRMLLLSKQPITKILSVLNFILVLKITLEKTSSPSFKTVKQGTMI